MMRTWERIKLAIILISVQVFISEAGGGIRDKTCLHLPGMLTLAQGMQEWWAEPVPDTVTDVIHSWCLSIVRRKPIKIQFLTNSESPVVFPFSELIVRQNQINGQDNLLLPATLDICLHSSKFNVAYSK
jgi:hypothetical protein